jgi:hypothetical protein
MRVDGRLSTTAQRRQRIDAGLRVANQWVDFRIPAD